MVPAVADSWTEVAPVMVAPADCVIFPPLAETETVVNPTNGAATLTEPFGTPTLMAAVLLVIAFKVTGPARLSVTRKLPSELPVIELAVTLAVTVPVPPFKVKAPVVSDGPIYLVAPLAPSRVIDVAALRVTEVRLTFEPVDFRLILSAVMLFKPASVIWLEDTIETEPVPAVVAFVTSPKLTAPEPAVSETVS